MVYVSCRLATVRLFQTLRFIRNADPDCELYFISFILFLSLSLSLPLTFSLTFLFLYHFLFLALSFRLSSSFYFKFDKILILEQNCLNIIIQIIISSDIFDMLLYILSLSVLLTKRRTEI